MFNTIRIPLHVGLIGTEIVWRKHRIPENKSLHLLVTLFFFHHIENCLNWSTSTFQVKVDNANLRSPGTGLSDKDLSSRHALQTTNLT